MGTKLYVGNLSYDSSEDSITQMFAQDGRTVATVTIVTDRETGRPRGFAFVEMESEADAKAAIEALNGTEMDGRTLRVDEAQERRTRDSGAGRGGRRGW